MEQKEIPEVDFVFVQNEFQSYVEKRSRTADSAAERKDELENYAYSYSIPAPGSDVASPTDDPIDGQADPQGEAQYQEGVPVGRTFGRDIIPRLKGLNFANMRMLGVLGWTGIAAAGGVAVMLESSPAVDFQLGTLSVVWFAVSAAIWFLPAKLAPQTGAARS